MLSARARRDSQTGAGETQAPISPRAASWQGEGLARALLILRKAKRQLSLQDLLQGGQPGTPVSSSQHYLCPFLLCSMAMLLGCQEEVMSAQQFENIKQFINSEHKSSSVNVPSNSNSSLRV